MEPITLVVWIGVAVIAGAASAGYLQGRAVGVKKLSPLEEASYELAFGDGASEKEYTDEQVIEKLFEMSQEPHGYFKYQREYIQEEFDRGNPLDLDVLQNAYDAYEGGAR